MFSRACLLSMVLIVCQIVHLDKQIAQLEKRNAYSNHTKIPVRRLEKFSKAEEATLKYAGRHEISPSIG